MSDRARVEKRDRNSDARPWSLALLALGLCAFALVAGAESRESAVLTAVKRHDRAVLRTLLAEPGQNASSSDPDGTSALMWAVHFNDLEMAEALLAAGAEAKATNRYGVGSLYLAAQNGNAPMITALLKRGADVNAVIPGGETALMTAARTGNVSAIDALINARANVDATEASKGQTALMWAAAENNAAAMKALIAAGANIDARSAAGEYTALAFAVRGGAIAAARVLLEAKADANGTLNDGTSMLLLAVTNAHYELAALLLKFGANPNVDEKGWTPLHQLAWTRRWNLGNNLPGPVATGDMASLDLVRMLIASGANINARERREPFDGNRNKLARVGATPFLLAAKSCDLPLLRLLLDLGADPSIPTQDGTTPLMAAAGVGIWAPGENPGTHEEALATVRLLLDAGRPDVNAANANGDTALHGAVYRGGAIPVIELLVEKGARLDVANKLGWTPLIVAQGVEYTPNVLKRYPEAEAAIEVLLAKQKPTAAIPTAANAQ